MIEKLLVQVFYFEVLKFYLLKKYSRFINLLINTDDLECHEEKLSFVTFRWIIHSVIGTAQMEDKRVKYSENMFQDQLWLVWTYNDVSWTVEGTINRFVLDESSIQIVP